MQTISVLAYVKDRFNQPGPHLIVAPLGKGDRWMAEFEWCSGYR